jgi:hypothetical protein
VVSNPAATEFNSGQEITLDVTGKAGTGSAVTYTNNTFGIRYTDYAGLERDANVTCSSPITIT